MLDTFFRHPWFLITLLAAGLPILIEWLFRKRRREFVLPTVRFLLKREENEKVKRQDRILLILRTLVCFLVALATSRPILHARGAKGAGAPVIVLIDSTSSMQQGIGLTSAFGLARKRVAELIRNLPEGTAVSVVLLSRKAESLAENSKERFSIANKVETLHAPEGSASIREGLSFVKDLLTRTNTPSAEIYIVSDVQKFTWLRSPEETSAASAILKQLAANNEINIVDTKGDEQFNLAAMSLAATDPLLSTGFPAQFTAEVRLFGSMPPDSKAAVTFLVDGEKKETRTVTGSATMVFAYRFPASGEHLVAIEVEGDTHKLDNKRMALVTVPEDVRILILDPTADQALTRRQSFYLAAAVAPAPRPGFDKASRFAVKTILPAQANLENFPEYGAIVLLPSDSIDEALAGKLNSYVRRGGAALCFLGPAINPYDYNQRLFREGSGILPASLGSPADGKFVLHFLSTAIGATSEDPALLAVSGYIPLEKVARDTETLASLTRQTGGDIPAVLLHEVGRGRICLCNFTPSLRSGIFPATAQYPLFLQNLLRQLIGNPDKGVNLQIGDRFESPIFTSTQQLLLRGPGNYRARLTPERTSDGESGLVRFIDTSRNGIYEIDAAPEIIKSRRFVVNPDTNESDLSAASKPELETAFGNGWTYSSFREAWVEAIANRHAVTELAGAALWILAVILLVESLLAVRFGRRRIGGIKQGGAL
jgi:hypothetical protein